MAYIVNNFNGEFLTSVSDGTIDTSTDIRFVGKNYAGYGEIQNENFLHLMENFANATPPSKAVIGQIWYDSTSTEKKLKFWDGLNWKTAGGAKPQSTAPTGELTAGEFWWDTASKQLYAWSGTEFILVGPDTPPDLGSAAVSVRVVKDINETPHSIVEIKSNGITVAVVSEDNDFLLKTVENSIPGFNPPNVIKKGITLSNTGPTGITSTQHRFWGTTSNALKLGGVEASQFISLLEGNFSQDVRFQNNGYTLGNNNELRVWNDTNGDGILLQLPTIDSDKFTVRIGSSSASNTVIFDMSGIKPAEDEIFDLGSSNKKWNTLYSKNIIAENIEGELTGKLFGDHTGNLFAANSALMIDYNTNYFGSPDNSSRFRGVFTGTFGTIENPGDLTGTATLALKLSTPIGEALATVISTGTTIPVRDQNGDIFVRNVVASGSVNKSDQLAIFNQDVKLGYFSASSTIPSIVNKTSVVARDSVGDIYAALFRGTATAARYADLAEKYLTDREYEVGTVVTIGGTAEIRSSIFGDRAIGVISTNPAFMMNSELEGGTYVALKGRVPVKVIGSVKKGDRLIAADNGCAMIASFHQYQDVFAIALESSDDVNTKKIEAVIL